MKATLTLRVPAFLALAVLSAFVLSSCPKKGAATGSGSGGTEVSGDQGGDSGASGAESGGFGGPSSSFVLRAGAGFWTLSGSEMKWKDALTLGQSVEIAGKPVKGSYQKNEYDIVPVKLESGTEGYVIDQQLAIDATMATVTSDLATLYKQPKDAAVLATIVPLMNIVAVWPVQGSSDFYRIVCYDSVSGERYADRFLAANDVSVDSADVETSLLLSAIKGVPKKEQKRKLLDTILSKYPASAFSGTVQELQIALEPEKMGTVPMSGDYVASEDGSIRDIPSIFGAVVKKLAKGDVCAVVEATSEQFSIGESSASWIRVSSPAEGWVFGDILEAKP